MDNTTYTTASITRDAANALIAAASAASRDIGIRVTSVAQLAHQPRLVAVGGGVPIVAGGKLVGGIGISGGNAVQDQQAAEIALKALGFDVAA